MGGWTAKPQLGLSNALGAPVCNFLEKPKDRTLKHAKRNPWGGSFLQLFRWLSLGVSRNIARPSGLYYRLSWAEVLLLYSLLEKMFVGLVPHTVWVPRTYTSHFYPVAANLCPEFLKALASRASHRDDQGQKGCLGWQEGKVGKGHGEDHDFQTRKCLSVPGAMNTNGWQFSSAFFWILKR